MTRIVSTFALLLLPLMALPQSSDFQRHGHRGARGNRPENTLAAFEYAVLAGCNWLETDIAITADSIVILSHEPWMNPAICTDTAGQPIPAGNHQHRIIDLTLAQLQAYDCGSTPHPDFPQQVSVAGPKPTLEALLHAFGPASRTPAGSPIRFNIEVKARPTWDNDLTPPVETICDLLMAQLQRSAEEWAGLDSSQSAETWLQDRVLIQSFDARVLRYLRQRYSFPNLALLSAQPRSPRQVERLLGFRPVNYSPLHTFVNARTVRRFHAAGIRVVPWTVNEAPRIHHLIRLGVDGIITDYPDLF